MEREATPTATLIEKTPNQTFWRVKFPSTLKKQGVEYIVRTYPHSDSIYIETAVKRRAVAQGVAHRLTPVIRAALSKAGATHG